MTSIQDMLAFERLIPERLQFEVTQWASDHECTHTEAVEGLQREGCWKKSRLKGTNRMRSCTAL